MAFIRKTLIFAALCAPLVPFGLSAQTPNVVVSLKPIHSLVAGVMGEAGKPRLLLKGAASPHTYQMRPSDAQALAEADLIVWVGEPMETFLHRAIENLGSRARVVTLHEVPGMRLLRNREGGIWEDDDHGEPHVDEHEGHGHEHDEFNMHVWLDPDNARRIVDEVAEALIFLDPARSATWRANAAATRKRIADLHASLEARLAPVRGRAFVVFHDAYQYFERAYGLDGKGAVAVDPARAPSAKRLVELRAALAEHKIRCVFTEPQFEPDLVRTVVEGSDVRTAVLDPVGADTVPGPDAWIEIMRGLGDAMTGCLGEG
ncbi:MAG: zinc ABC transporter substrate-binding protein [Defluviicoccus sp.]|nr:zinc ABC transporter substrate-binding protein [Defluviicoccus sp.]MDE0384984.1 zinc ABC transporter substrate-binding protein [Defluviicoccus sp.]